jgi:hypothetical protein
MFLALTLAPAALFAQTAPPQNPPAQQQPPATEQPPAPAAPRLTFTAPAGLLLVQIKPDQTAKFEELVSKLQSGIASATDPTLKQTTTGWKVYKSSEPMGANALYVVLVDPATPSAEYDFFMMLQKTMTPEQLRDPATQELFKGYTAAFAAGYNKLNLTPLGGGQ